MVFLNSKAMLKFLLLWELVICLSGANVLEKGSFKHLGLLLSLVLLLPMKYVRLALLRDFAINSRGYPNF